MKTKLSLQLITAVAFFSLIVSCSSDDTRKEENGVVFDKESNIENSMNRQLNNSDVLDFLDDYFKNSYSFGDTESVADGLESYEVTEIFQPNDTLPKGYVVTEKITEELMFFADYDRINKEINAFDFVEDESFLIKDLGEDGYGNDIMETDVIDYLKDLPNHSSERRFWGWTCGSEQCYGTGANEECYRNCCYYIFWFENGCGDFPVDELPGKRPKIISN